MAAERVDERVMGAGTTVRFVLLVVLLFVASGSMIADVVGGISGSSGRGCELAGGADPNESTLQIQLVLAQQYQAYTECRARYQPPPPWWVSVGWPILVLAGASLLFWGIPVWKARRGRVVPLEAVDHDGALRRLLAEVTVTAGLERVPRVVVDPMAASTGAVVFGRNRRPTVCLHGGLLARATTDPENFRAVLLHELAHIRYGDVTLTYATVAMWRVFLGVVLVPYAVWSITALVDGFWAGDRPYGIRAVLLTLFMVVLVYLARSDVLRSREIYADLAAARWGADRRFWAVTASPGGGRLSRLAGPFAEMWRTHPRWDLRRAALADPAGLFGVRALPMFLTGIAATLINSAVQSSLPRHGLLNGWAEQALALVSASLVTGVAGIALWRAVAYAVLTSRRVPSGVRAGLWLGFGMAVGELVVNRVAVTEWLPAHPEILVLVVLAGAAVGWWIGQCARLWATTWRARSICPAMLVSLAAACLALSSWFVWWHHDGTVFTRGSPFGTAQISDLLARGLGGPVADHAAMLSAVATVFPVLHGLSAPALGLVAVGALWIVPLLAWTVRPADGTPRWLRGALHEVAVSHEALPRLRRVLLPGLLGGALGWLAVAGVQAYLHTWRPLPRQAGALYALTYQTWVLVVLIAATAAAAIAASVLAGRYRLLVTLIAAQTAVVVGFAGMLVLTSVDGCIPPLATLQSSCGWYFTTTGLAFKVMLTPVVVVGAIVAVVAAAVASMVERLRRTTPLLPRPATGVLAARRGIVGVLCVAAAGIAATGIVVWEREHSSGDDSVVAQLFKPAGDRPVASRTKAAQVFAWYQYGGEELNRRMADVESRFAAALTKAGSSPPGQADVSPLLPICADFGQIARDAERYFRVPEPQAQTHWQSFVSQAGQGSKNCVSALDQPDGQVMDKKTERLFLHSLSQLEAAEAAANSTLDRAIRVMHGNG